MAVISGKISLKVNTDESYESITYDAFYSHELQEGESAEEVRANIKEHLRSSLADQTEAARVALLQHRDMLAGLRTETPEPTVDGVYS